MQSGHDASNLLLVFGATRMGNKTAECGVEPTKLTSVGEENRYSDWDENVVDVFDEIIYWPSPYCLGGMTVTISCWGFVSFGRSKQQPPLSDSSKKDRTSNVTFKFWPTFGSHGT